MCFLSSAGLHETASGMTLPMHAPTNCDFEIMSERSIASRALSTPVSDGIWSAQCSSVKASVTQLAAFEKSLGLGCWLLISVHNVAA